MESLFKRMVNLFSNEMAKKDTGTEQHMIKKELDRMGTDDIRAMLAKGLREYFIPENPKSTPYRFDDMIDFLQWLHDRFGLGTVVRKHQPSSNTGTPAGVQ